MIQLDGRLGEGGGQILRTALALSCLTGQPFHIRHIRAGRQRPGLLRQHLTCVRAALRISDGHAEGAALGSTELTFRPEHVRGGTFEFSVGTAGSAGLVLQTVLYPLLLAAHEPSQLTLRGGTHNDASPPAEFLQRTFLPLLARAGAPVEFSVPRRGFYPAGGGTYEVLIEPVEDLRPLVLDERGPLESLELEALVANLPPSIGHREMASATASLGVPRTQSRVFVVESDGPGNAVLATARHQHVTQVFTAFGRKGVSSEQVGQDLADQVHRWLDLDVPVDEHLADQLLLPLALAGGGRFRTGPLSDHTTTNLQTIAAFLPFSPRVVQDGSGAWLVDAKP